MHVIELEYENYKMPTRPNLKMPVVCLCCVRCLALQNSFIVSAHRRILGMALVVCVLVKICVSSISFYKLDTEN